VTGQQETTWTPAFPGQRPPFQPGNDLGRKFESGHDLTLKHGAYSLRKIGPIADRLVASLLADESVAYLRVPAYLPALQAWSRAEARVRLLTAWLEDHGGLGVSEEGDLSPVLSALQVWESRAEKARTRLGLDPMSRMVMARDLAMAKTSHDLDKLKQIGRALLASHDGDTRPGDDQEEDSGND
jgi:hypothetical protein